jgi:hypothetical protein
MEKREKNSCISLFLLSAERNKMFQNPFALTPDPSPEGEGCLKTEKL